MLFGRIFCRVLKYVVVVEYGLKLRGEDVAELVYLYSTFEDDID